MFRAEQEPSVLVVGPGGGASVLTTDACDRAGLRLAPVDEGAQQSLRGFGYGAGTSLANPLEIPLGPASAPDGFARVLEPVLASQRYSDILLHINVAAYYGYGPPNLQPLADLVSRTGSIDTGSARVALVLRNAEVARGEMPTSSLPPAARPGSRRSPHLTQRRVPLPRWSASPLGGFDVKQMFDLLWTRSRGPAGKEEPT